jgi:hypothetical protein
MMNISEDVINVITMSDAAIGWAIIIGFFCIVGSCNRSPEAAKSDSDIYKSTTSTDKPIKVGDTTYRNEKELIDAVCKADPTVRGCS